MIDTMLVIVLQLKIFLCILIVDRILLKLGTTRGHTPLVNEEETKDTHCPSILTDAQIFSLSYFSRLESPVSMILTVPQLSTATTVESFKAVK